MGEGDKVMTLIYGAVLGGVLLGAIPREHLPTGFLFLASFAWGSLWANICRRFDL